MLRHSTDERSISSMRSVSGIPIAYPTLWTIRASARRPEVTRARVKTRDLCGEGNPASSEERR